MKKILLFAVLIFVIACKNKTASIKDSSNETLVVTTSKYPENLTKVFEAHGGLDLWNDMQKLEFTMPKKNGDEVTLTDLKSRKSLINMPDYAIGFDGKDVWLQNKGDKKYTRDARFYYNLMFYFYAMPFILADDGIIYSDAEPLEFEGKLYPGILISYDAGVGESPEDEYILYYDAETYQMKWLGYTVTYHTKEKGKEFHFRKFSEWQDVGGLKLPKVMTRYKYKDNKPTEAGRDTEFTNIKISKEKPKSELFDIPEGAEIVD